MPAWGHGMVFSEWLREQMKNRGYSQARLAQTLGVSQSLISNWLQGVGRPPSTDKLVALSGLFRYDHLALMEMAGVLSDRDPTLPNGDEQTLINTLKTLRGTPAYKPTLHTLQTIADLATILLDPPDAEGDSNDTSGISQAMGHSSGRDSEGDRS